MYEYNYERIRQRKASLKNTKSLRIAYEKLIKMEQKQMYEYKYEKIRQRKAS